MTDAFEVIAYTSEHSEAWDGLVRRSRNGTFLHERSFMDYHADRFQDCSALVFFEQELVAIFPANRSGFKVTSHGGLTFGGLIYGIDQRAVSIRAALGSLLDYYGTQGVQQLRYKAVPHLFHRYPAEEDLYALFLHGARLVRRDLSAAVLLSHRPKTTESRKGGIRKAQKAGLRIVEGDFFESFHQLLSDVLVRHDSAPVHSVSEMVLLQSRFPERLMLIGAFDGDQLLAGSWLFHFDGVTHFQYLASSDAGRQIGALDFLIGHVIDTPRYGVTAFSFGASTEKEGHYLNEGLMFQKEGFGARGVVLDQYEINL